MEVEQNLGCKVSHFLILMEQRLLNRTEDILRAHTSDVLDREGRHEFMQQFEVYR